MVDAITTNRLYAPYVQLQVRSPAWTRLEPQSRSGDPAVGLAAEVADPLWLLGRQWQVGEWVGEDAGTPLTVTLAARGEVLTRWQPGEWAPEHGAPADAGDLPPDVPWEQSVEPEPAAPPGLRARAEAAAALLVALNDGGWHKAATAVVAHHPALAAPGAGATWTGPALLLVARGADADGVAGALEVAGGLPPWWLRAVPAGERAAATATAMTWLAWYREAVAPAPGTDAWVGRRLEYRFSVGGGGVVLRAPQYQAGGAGRGVDWWAVDLDADVTELAPLSAPTESYQLRQTVLATPLTYPGMPASRFWEMEDADVDLGSVGADPHDLARLLVIECGLVYGCDWLVVPLDVPAGSFVQLAAVTYTTTFGERYLVEGVPDPRAPAAAIEVDPWRMWTTTVEGRSWETRASGAGERAALPGLLVPPTSAGRLEGRPVEEVVFLRDENADLVWAVERIVATASGDPNAPRPATATTESTGEPGVPDAELDYRLQTTVPPWWIPYLPTTDSYSSVELVRGAMLRFDPADPTTGVPVEPTGRLLREPGTARLASAEVPREGVRVQRVPVVARDGSGRYHSWTVRRVSVGRGEGRSGLEFDAASLRIRPPE